MHSLEKILPQKPPMILLSRVVEHDLKERTLIAEVDISPESVFFDYEIKGIPCYIGLEYMAQTVGCLLGIENQKPPAIELVLGTRNFEFSIQKFSVNYTYRISIKEQFVMEEMSSFNGEISNDQNVICARGDIKVYYRNDLNELLRQENG
jgi:predicted hotdog family 3-hydroxylacyl-ACP dehydratase